MLRLEMPLYPKLLAEIALRAGEMTVLGERAAVPDAEPRLAADWIGLPTPKLGFVAEELDSGFLEFQKACGELTGEGSCPMLDVKGIEVKGCIL